MSFFKKFDTVQYALDGYSKEAMNIIQAAILKRLNVDRTFVYQKYLITDGQTPESVAHALYDDPNLWWTFFLVNSRVNPMLDWPMDQTSLEEYVNMVHGDPNKILFFTNIDTGKRYDDVSAAEYREMIESGAGLPHYVHPVTAFQYETERNAELADIIVISKKYITQFVDMFNRAIEGKV